MKWLLFQAAISSAVESCERKRLRMASGSEKRTPWWNQDVREAIQAKKVVFKALLLNRSTFYLQSRYSAARKAAACLIF